MFLYSQILSTYMDQTTQPSAQGEKKGLTTSTKVIIGILAALVAFGILVVIGVAILITVVSKNAINNIDTSYEYSSDWSSYYDDTTYGEWQPFTDSWGRFNVELPGYPTTEMDSTPVTGTDVSVWYDMYSSEDENAYYSVTVSEYPIEVDLGEPEDNLSTGLDGLLASTGASLMISSFEEVQGNTALSFTASTPDGIYLQGKSIVQGQVLYQLMVAYEDGDASAEGRDRFFNSFVLVQ